VNRAPLAVLASRVRFEEKQIFAALDRRGVPYVHLDTRRITALLDARPEEYAAALNREISQSRGYYASLLFEACGVPTVNRAAVIEVCGDKLRTSLELRRSSLPTPRTALALTPEAALCAADLLGYPVVIKPLTGSWGRLASLVRDRAEAETVLEHRAALSSPQQHIIYLQELVDKPDRDIRVLVAGERVVAASYRYSDGWRTNARRGGRSEPCPLTPELTALALAAAKAVGGGVLGVDLIEGPDGLQVLEVNHTVEFQGLQTAHEGAVDVADAIVAHALDAA
jgi:[lysine-biosynthesis-protein LysW]---L-2-aminoadipate ligase